MRPADCRTRRANKLVLSPEACGSRATIARPLWPRACLCRTPTPSRSGRGTHQPPVDRPRGSSSAPFAGDERGAPPAARPRSARCVHLHPPPHAPRRGRPAPRAQRRAPPQDRPRRWRPLFADLPEAVANTERLADRLEFGLENLGYEFPAYPVPARRDHGHVSAQDDHGSARSSATRDLSPAVRAQTRHGSWR